jgi:hypothetical protein
MLDDAEWGRKTNKLKSNIKHVSAMTINTPDYKFNREEANAR